MGSGSDPWFPSKSLTPLFCVCLFVCLSLCACFGCSYTKVAKACKNALDSYGECMKDTAGRFQKCRAAQQALRECYWNAKVRAVCDLSASVARARVELMVASLTSHLVHSTLCRSKMHASRCGSKSGPHHPPDRGERYLECLDAFAI